MIGLVSYPTLTGPIRKMEYQDFEDEGREYLRERAQEWANRAHRARVNVKDGRDSRGRNTKKMKAAEEVEAKYRAELADTKRYVWLIEIHGYGDWQWVGTAASAHGRRICKARWEHRPSSLTRLSEARDDEPNGDVPEEREHKVPSDESAAA